MFLDETGDPAAPAIVFLHGDGASGEMWSAHVARMSEYHCILPDLPGFGRSSGQEWTSLPATADAIAGIIRTRTRAMRAHVVGLSLGGCVALQLLARSSTLIDHAIVDGAGVVPIRGASALKVGLRLIQPFLHTKPVIRLLAKAMRVSAGGFEGFARDLRRMSPTAFTRSFIEALEMGEPDGLVDATVPTLLVAGEREEHASSLYLSRRMKNARAYAAPGGHAWLAEHGSLHIEMVRSFLEDRPLPKELRALIDKAVIPT